MLWFKIRWRLLFYLLSKFISYITLTVPNVDRTAVATMSTSYLTAQCKCSVRSEVVPSTLLLYSWSSARLGEMCELWYCYILNNLGIVQFQFDEGTRLRWNAVFLMIRKAGALRRKPHSEHAPFLWGYFMVVEKSAMGIVTREHNNECTCLVEDYPSLRRSHMSQSDYYASQSLTVFHYVLESYAPHWGYVDLSMWSKIRN